MAEEGLAAQLAACMRSGSRIPQIIQNFRQGHTGQLAFVPRFCELVNNAYRSVNVSYPPRQDV